MASIHLTISNQSGAPQVVHVFDTLQGGTRPVEGSPFSLAIAARSQSFDVRADACGHGLVAYRSESRLIATGIDVVDGAAVELR
jgi:hypothetical protein